MVADTYVAVPMSILTAHLIRINELFNFIFKDSSQLKKFLL